MCILGGGSSHPHAPNRTWYERQAKRGGWFFDRAAVLLGRVGAHPLGDVMTGRMRLRDWARFELTPTAHKASCRYRRTCALVGWT